MTLLKKQKDVILDWIACHRVFQRPIKSRQNSSSFIYGVPKTQKTRLVHFLDKALRIDYASYGRTRVPIRNNTPRKWEESKKEGKRGPIMRFTTENLSLRNYAIRPLRPDSQNERDEVWTDEAFNPENPGGAVTISQYAGEPSRRMLMKTEMMATGPLLMTRFIPRLTPLFDEASLPGLSSVAELSIDHRGIPLSNQRRKLERKAETEKKVRFEELSFDSDIRYWTIIAACLLSHLLPLSELSA